MPGHYVRRVGLDSRDRKVPSHHGEVSRGRSTGGEKRAGKGRTPKRGSLDVLAEEAMTAANFKARSSWWGVG